MTDENIAQVMVATILAAVVLLALWHRRRIPNWGDLPDVSLDREGDGSAIVPVSMLLHRRTLWSTSNGISPQLRITSAGLRFKVFRPNEKAFADFKHVAAYPALWQGTRLVFIGYGEQLHLLIPDRATARAVLRLLPASLPLTPAAAALRGPRPSSARW